MRLPEMEEKESNEIDEPVPTKIACPECGQTRKTPQGLAGHRRLAHSTTSAQVLAERGRVLDEQRRGLESKSTAIARREADAKRLDAELSRRKREIEVTGPSSIGLVPCDECGAWFDDSEMLQAHVGSIHPLEGRVAAEVGVSRERVDSVWTEACRKQKRHPNNSPDQIVGRFWDGTDQKILRSLLDHNAAFKLEEE